MSKSKFGEYFPALNRPWHHGPGNARNCKEHTWWVWKTLLTEAINARLWALQWSQSQMVKMDVSPPKRVTVVEGQRRSEKWNKPPWNQNLIRNHWLQDFRPLSICHFFFFVILVFLLEKVHPALRILMFLPPTAIQMTLSSLMCSSI